MPKRILIIDGHSDPLSERYVHALAGTGIAVGRARALMKRITAGVVGVAAILVPVIVLAFANSRQELTDALHSRPNRDRGAELFRNCAICHGPSGGGTLDGGVPRIAGQHFSVIVKQLVDYRHNRRRDFRMEHFTDQHHLADAQAIADVANYINQLEAEVPPGVGSGEFVDHGAQLYAQRCQSCHGHSAEGDGKAMVPKIAGQHFEYLLRQIYEGMDGRRPNFPVAHVRLLARLEHEDIEGLADYLSRSLEPTAQVGLEPIPDRD